MVSFIISQITGDSYEKISFSFAAFSGAADPVPHLPRLGAGRPQPHARAALVVYGDTGEILYDFNAYERMYPASLTKIMTSLVVLDAVGTGELSMDTEAAASAQALDLPWDASKVGLQVGEVLTIEQLLYCDLLPSACDACNVLAEAVAGSMEAFVDRMNAKAAQLGLENTHFANPHGYHDPNHYTTAYEVYLMARIAMENETFRTIVGTQSYTLPATNSYNRERTLRSTNLLLDERNALYYSKAIGIKTGFTDEAGRCLASAAVDEEGRTFYCVVLGCEPTDEDGKTQYWSFSESQRLLEWAFENFHHTVLLDQNTEDVLREVEVSLSDEADYVLVRPKGEIAATMPSDYNPKLAKLDFRLPTEPVEAPITAGQKLGTVTFSYQGVVYGTLDLVAMDSVERSDYLSTKQQIENTFQTIGSYWAKWWVKAAVFGGIALILLLIMYITVIRPKQRRARRYSYSGGSRRGRGRSNYRGRR